jgi:hypothetical protein
VVVVVAAPQALLARLVVVVVAAAGASTRPARLAQAAVPAKGNGRSHTGASGGHVIAATAPLPGHRHHFLLLVGPPKKSNSPQI